MSVIKGLDALDRAIDLTAGNLTLATGDLDLTAGGIHVGGAGAANYLDDYEEGTFTAAFVSGTGTVTIDPTDDTLFYTKIGRIVFITGQVSVSSVSSPTGTLALTGLPFTSSASASIPGAMAFCFGLSPAISGVPLWVVASSSTQINFLDFNGASGTSDLANHIIASTGFRIFACYLI